jgi:nickel transport protein
LESAFLPHVEDYVEDYIMRVIIVLLFMLLSLLGLPNPALAHAMQTDYVTPSPFELDIRAEFSSGEAFADAPVRVFSPRDAVKPWLEGKTDAQGNFSFTPDRKITGDWTIKIGERDHADILKVPVTAQGMDEQTISQGVPVPVEQNWSQVVVLGLAVSSGIGARLLFSRR